MTFAYCRVCRSNHNNGKGHKYQKKHKLALEKTLLKQAQIVSEYKLLSTNENMPPTTENTITWCIFCDSEVNNVGTPIACYGMVHHLATKDHKKHVLEFFKDMGASNKEDRTKYLIQRGEFNQVCCMKAIISYCMFAYSPALFHCIFLSHYPYCT